MSDTVTRTPMNEKETTREWIPPPEDSIKVNVDAAYCNATKVASLGVIARNSRSKIRFSAVTKEGGIESPLQAEVKAILFGL